MKFLERFALVIYSYIIILLSVVLSLLVFNWIDFDVVTDMVYALVTGAVSSKITLGVSVVFILLSIKCIFFDDIPICKFIKTLNDKNFDINTCLRKPFYIKSFHDGNCLFYNSSMVIGMLPDEEINKYRKPKCQKLN